MRLFVPLATIVDCKSVLPRDGEVSALVQMQSSNVKFEVDSDGAVRESALTLTEGVEVVTTLTMAGCPQNFGSSVLVEEADVEDSGVKHYVRCCHANTNDKISMQGTSNYGCQGKKSYVDALQVCQGVGDDVTLCTQQQLEAGATCSTGCSYDGKRVWTLASQEVSPPSIPEPPSPPPPAPPPVPATPASTTPATQAPTQTPVSSCWIQRTGACSPFPIAYKKGGWPEADCRQTCREDDKCVGFTLWKTGRTKNACHIHVPERTDKNDADLPDSSWAWAGSVDTSPITGSNTDGRAICEFQTVPEDVQDIAMNGEVLDGCGSQSSSVLRMGQCTETSWQMKVGCMIGLSGVITVTFLSDEANSRDKNEKMEVIVDGQVVAAFMNTDCNPDSCEGKLAWPANAQTLKIRQVSTKAAKSVHMQIEKMVFVSGEVLEDDTHSCGEELTSELGGKFKVHAICLPENISPPVGSNLPERSTLMPAAADTSEADVVYFSWTADLPFGKNSTDGRVYISKLNIGQLGQTPTVESSVNFDGFVKNGGIAVTDNGKVGTLCAKFVPSWMELCSPDAWKNYCPYALGLCEATTGGGLKKERTPWMIGKQYFPVNSHHGGGKSGAYPFSFAKSAGAGYLIYSTHHGSWNTWYGASWGSHTGYAMHTFNDDAPPLSASKIDTWKQDYPELVLHASEMEYREENLDPTDHNRRGTGDHQAGAAWAYSDVLQDIGLLKHTHGGVYMQQYGLSPVTDSSVSAFAPTGKHGNADPPQSRVYLTFNGDEAKTEGGLRGCGDEWILALQTATGGNVCAKVSQNGTITKWVSIDPTILGGARQAGMVRIAPLGQPVVTECNQQARFLFGYAKSDDSRWLVEVDGECTATESTRHEVTQFTTWPLKQDWVTTGAGAVVWITQWDFGQDGTLSTYTEPKACTFPSTDSEGYRCAAASENPSDQAKLTVYHP